MIATVLRALARPDDQGRDWYAWATVQMAHALIGALLAAGLIFAVGSAAIGAGAAAAIYTAAKEIRDVLAVPTLHTLWDSLQDALFVAGGAAFAAALVETAPTVYAGALAAGVAGLAWGVASRISAST